MIDESIPFLNLTRMHSQLREVILGRIQDLVDRSEFIGGEAVASFEEAFARAHSAPAAAGCSSGTDALALALRALGVGPGDEVIVPSMTFIATAEAVWHAGATPIIADVNESTLLLDEESVSAVRTRRTKAVIPVHLYGNCVPFSDLRAWREDGLIVVEDACQAHLATWQNKYVSSVGHAACFSFFPGKNLGAFGDAGAVVSHDLGLVTAVKRLRDHGRSSKYRHEVLGYGARMDSLQAAILQAKLDFLPQWTAQRRALAEKYRARLSAIGTFDLQVVPWETGSVHHLVVIRVPPRIRGPLRNELDRRRIGSGIHYPVPLSNQEALRPWWRSTPLAEQAAREVLSLPMDPLMSLAEVDRVCDVLLTFRA